jgi:putative iron-dependent peroxidase
VLPPGIFALGFSAEDSVELDRAQGATSAQLVAALARFALDTGVPHATNVVVGIRPSIWAEVEPGAAALAGADFRAIQAADGYTLPETQRDAWVWITGATAGSVFDTATLLATAVEGSGEIVAETQGFGYRETRDLTGFRDGTENPTVAEAMDLLPVPDGQPGAGGTCLLLQSWLHEGAAWMSLDEHAQERVIGRTKADSVELEESAMPADAHVPRTTVQDAAGEELDIFRRNSPVGTMSRHGTLFIGFSPDFERMTTMLEQMLGLDPGGERDALTRYTTALSGAHYFVPSYEQLRQVSG